MADKLLWRRLTETDFNAINGKAAPSGTGGGAMHIALGTSNARRPIAAFLDAEGKAQTTITTQPIPPDIPASKLTFSGNPQRRGGEWRINDQFNHRHPAWSPKNGFPTSYNPKDRPIVFVVRQGKTFHTRFSTESQLKKSIPTLAALINASQGISTGIANLDAAWTTGLQVKPALLEAYKEIEEDPSIEALTAFDPKSGPDGRKKIVAEVFRRQGQRSFRKKLLAAYQKKCAITGTNVEVTLEAAHITPYKGAHTNNPSNGILLRADLHTLFDLGLISIKSKDFTVQVSSTLKNTEYMKLAGAKIFLPAEGRSRPSSLALDEHYASFVD